MGEVEEVREWRYPIRALACRTFGRRSRDTMIFALFRSASKVLKELEGLRQDYDKLRRDVAGLELEWSDMHDRLRRMLAKISKRNERSDNLLREEEPQAEGGDTPYYEPGPRLSPTQSRIQQQILARRNRMPADRGEG